MHGLATGMKRPQCSLFTESMSMHYVKTFFTSLLLCFIASLSSSAQLPPPKDPLNPAQTVQSAAACSATDASSCAQAAAKILPQVMGPSPMEENLRRLTDEIGGRVTGSPQMAKAIEWAVAAFRAEGVEVHTEKYTLPHSWSEGNSRIELLGPVKFPIRGVSVAWTPATPPGGIEANVIDIGDGTQTDFANVTAHVKGAILLVHNDVIVTYADLANEWAKPLPIIARAAKEGAAAILWMGARDHLLLYRAINTSDGEIDKIPQAILAREDAMRLARTIAAYPAKVRVRLDLPNNIGGPIEQENVVGEIRGYEKPDEAVILAAHLDSWELGTGALDNGCNAAMVIEAARAIKATGLLPRRSIRFVLFSGEELGLLGSHAYVQAHRAEMDKIRAMITADYCSGRFTGYSLGGRRDTEAAVREILRPLESWNVNNHTYDMDLGSDHVDFFLEGVPTLAANQEDANYLANYHTASDTFDRVDMLSLKLNTVVVALTAWGVADRTEPLGKRLTHAEIEQHLVETGIDKQMKFFGLWDAWQSGARGRKL
jgi:carboxypeptidase Q